MSELSFKFPLRFYPSVVACFSAPEFFAGLYGRSAGLGGMVAAANRGSPRSDRITRALPPFLFLFYFRRRCEWSVAMGITDTMRDTLLLEFSQVRATLTDPRVPLCLPSRGK